ncbi:MAG: DUF4331 family protein [Gemmatirosa sp.]|nr:DUF4331 family protein [Gemmatirosa sp.]
MRNANGWTVGALVALTLAAAACSDDRGASGLTAPNGARAASAANGVIYDQVEFLGNPLVSEVTIVKANHDAYNRTQPYNTAQFRPETEAFVMNVGGRPQALATTLGSVLYPDMLVVDTSKDPSTAGWLSWALANGYGGRKLSDDVVDVALTAVFSSLLSPTNASCAPFQLPLCTDNVNANDRQFSTTFPYLATPNS